MNLLFTSAKAQWTDGFETAFLGLNLPGGLPGRYNGRSSTVLTGYHISQELYLRLTPQQARLLRLGDAAHYGGHPHSQRLCKPLQMLADLQVHTISYQLLSAPLRHGLGGATHCGGDPHPQRLC